MIRKADALAYHRQGRPGKLEVVPTKPLLTQRDLALAYSPGVAEPCLEIAEDPERGWEYTARGNLVAVISNGTAVLGLGNIGPLAGKPVMEGKGCLFKKFADIDVFDLEIAERDPQKFIDIVASLEPTFGGINLEDIKAPECFEIEQGLRKRMAIPVFHDDQHGTAIISGAALVNGAEISGKRLEDLRVVISGAGASAIACANFYVELGVRLENIVMIDSVGVIYEGRGEGMNQYKARFARKDDGRRTRADALRGADVLLGLSKAGLVTAEMLATMNDRPMIFALANPDPEVTYPDAKAARPDAIVATGRSDFPNQVNNVLGFPYIFRGALDVRAREINEAMKIAAARSLAELAHEPVPESVAEAYGVESFRFGPEYIIPKPLDPRVLAYCAPAVAKAAIDSGVARRKLDIEEYREQLRRRLGGVRQTIMRRIVQRAQTEPKRIVFPEGDNIKVLRACQIVLDQKIARPVLLGSEREIRKRAADLDLDLAGVLIERPAESPRLTAYAEELLALRCRKGVTASNVRELMRRRANFGMMMVRRGDADGLVAGLDAPYPETIRPALQILGLAPGVRRVMGMYMMLLKNDVKFFADPVVNIDPDARTLAEIAIQAADAVRGFEIVPRIAMISFSNFGSAPHPESTKMAGAVNLVRAQRPDLEIDGEVQADVALDPETLREMFPFARLREAPNVLVFSSLSAANAAYKVLAALGGADAVGPILLGLAKPVAVLPRDVSVDAIVHMTAHTVGRAQAAAKGAG